MTDPRYLSPAPERLGLLSSLVYRSLAPELVITIVDPALYPHI